jgi:hypothetical protein
MGTKNMKKTAELTAASIIDYNLLPELAVKAYAKRQYI